MTDFEIYVLILCGIVLALLTATFSWLISYIYRLQIKGIRGGLFDVEIAEEFERIERQKTRSKAAHVIVDIIVPSIICIALVIVFAFSLSVDINKNKKVGVVPHLKVVQSGSMAIKHQSNEYLVENNLDDQLQIFDVIVIDSLPKEEDLKIYDIVVYKDFTDGALVVHRIIEINIAEDDSGETWYLFKGDANQYADRYPVRYSDMIGIYSGTRIPYVGSFVTFMNSPAGYLCVLLVIGVLAVMPIIDKKLDKAKAERFGTFELNGNFTDDAQAFEDNEASVEDDMDNIQTTKQTQSDFVEQIIITSGMTRLDNINDVNIEADETREEYVGDSIVETDEISVSNLSEVDDDDFVD